MIIPSADRLEGKTGSLYALCVLAAKRARQLKDPMVRRLVDTQSTHPLTVALEEIAEDAIKARIVEVVKPEVEPIETEIEPVLPIIPVEEEAAAPLSVHDMLRVDHEEDLEAAEHDEEHEEVKDLFEAIASGEVEPLVAEEEEEAVEEKATEEEAEAEESEAAEETAEAEESEEDQTAESDWVSEDAEDMAADADEDQE